MHGAPAPAAGAGVHQPHVLSFYKISYRPTRSGQLRYGQGQYDFEEGGLLFAAPNQIIGGAEESAAGPCAQFTLLIHPDFLAPYPLAKKMGHYGFTYAANAALHVSEQEKELLLALFHTMEAELASRLDEFSQEVVIA